MQENSRQLVLAALTHCRGNRMKAATLLELSRAQFYKLVKMHGLDGEPAAGAPQQDPNGKNSIGCHELEGRRKWLKEEATNCEQKGNAGKKGRPITSKRKWSKEGTGK